MDLEFSSQIDVEVIDQSGDDHMIAKAARVSTGKDLLEKDVEKDTGLIRFLLKNKHGTPFEHGHITLRVSAPIFVWREHMRHRIGISYNEESGRYKQLDPKFYVPEKTRIQTGKPGHYVITETEDVKLNALTLNYLSDTCGMAYRGYETLLDQGVAREVARMALTVNIFSSAYVTMNPRSLMNFCELRLAENAQYEIRLVAQQYFGALLRYWPEVGKAFEENGLVAP